MQFFGIETIKNLVKATQTTIEWESGSKLRIAGQAYGVNSTITLSLSSDIDTGTVSSDTIYYIYAVVVSGVVSLKYSLSNTQPTGFEAFRKIGGFITDGSAEVLGTSVKDQGRVGDTIDSMLTPEQFINKNGPGWVLADGRNVVGSEYATITGNTTIPDMRGQFKRGKNNGRSDGQEDTEGERVLGDWKADKMQGHFHKIRNQVSSDVDGFPEAQSTASSGNTFFRGTNLSGRSIGVSNPRADGVNGTPRVGPETAPKNITVNIFIKINDIEL